MNNILVTGATGGLGRNAIDYLISAGCVVTATGRNADKLALIANARNIASTQADLSNSPLVDLVDGRTAIWHCAALSSPWGNYQDFYAANVIASERLFRAAAGAGVPVFIHVSTPAIYFDFRHRYAVREDWAADSFACHYAATKAQAEQRLLFLANEFPSTKLIIIRPRAIFGPHDQALFPRLLRLLEKGKDALFLPRKGKTVLDLTYVGNVAHAMWLATHAPVPSGSIYNITNDDPISIATALQELVVNGLGRRMTLKGVPYPMLMATAHVLDRIASVTGREPPLTPYSLGVLSYDMTLDISRAKNELGYRPIISMPAAFEHTVKWLRNG